MKSDILAFFLTPLNLSFFNVVLFVMSLYIIFEVIVVSMKMDRGARLCRLFKYLATGSSGVLGMVFSLSNLTMPLMLLFVLALDLFLWPTMLYRFRGDYRNRITDK